MEYMKSALNKYKTEKVDIMPGVEKVSGANHVSVQTCKPQGVLLDC
jgi:hypothetical protein